MPRDDVGGDAATWIVAAEIAVIYILSTLPTPIYVIYRQQFHFSEIVLTLIYSVYVIGTVTTMFFLGRLSDQIGRRPVVLISLGIASASAVVFLLANATVWLFPARILSGLAIALASGASTAWIIELQTRQDTSFATQVTIGANLLGLGLGPFIAGLLAEYAQRPLRLCYVVFLLLLFPTVILIWRSRETLNKPSPLTDASIQPRLGVPHQIRAQFISPAIAAFTTFSVLGFYMALVPSLLAQSLHNNNHAVAGLVVAELFFVAATVVGFTGKLESQKGMLLSLVLLIPSIGLLLWAEVMRSMWILIAGTAVTGVAAGLGYRFSLQVVNEIAPENRRSEMVSSYLIACYCGISLPVIGISIVSRASSALIADAIFAVITATLAVFAFLVQVKVSAAK
jgi:MFS family permease